MGDPRSLRRVRQLVVLGYWSDWSCQSVAGKSSKKGAAEKKERTPNFVEFSRVSGDVSINGQECIKKAVFFEILLIHSLTTTLRIVTVRDNALPG